MFVVVCLLLCLWLRVCGYVFVVVWLRVCGSVFVVACCGQGPAINTGRGWSWLRSGKEHWAWMVAVQVRQGTLGADGCG